MESIKLFYGYGTKKALEAMRVLSDDKLIKSMKKCEKCKAPKYNCGVSPCLYYGVMMENTEKIVESLVEVTLKDPQDFLKVREI